MLRCLKNLYIGLVYTPDGKVSHTKFWSNIAYCTATFVIIKLTYMNQLTENYFLFYLGVVASHASVSKMLGIRKENNLGELSGTRKKDRLSAESE